MWFTPRQKFRLLNWHRYERFVRALGPVFWQPMRNTSGSVSTNAVYTGGAGPELLSNRSAPFASSGDDPAGWTVIGEDDVNDLATVNGSGNLRIKTSAGGDLNCQQGGIAALGDTMRFAATVAEHAAGSIKVNNGAGSEPASAELLINGLGDFTWDYVLRAGSGAGVRRINGVMADMAFSKLSLKKIGELDGAIAGTTALAQIGLLGIHEAFLFDGATSLITIINRASIQGLTDFTLWALFKPGSAGEGSAGTLFSKSGELELRFNSASLDLIAAVNYSGTNAQRVTSTTLSANEWHTVGMRIDNSAKTPEIFVDGVEASYASTTVGVGTRVSNTSHLIVGNNAAVSQTLAGLLDEILLANRTLTANELRLLHLLAGLD